MTTKSSVNRAHGQLARYTLDTVCKEGGRPGEHVSWITTVGHYYPCRVWVDRPALGYALASGDDIVPFIKTCDHIDYSDADAQLACKLLDLPHDPGPTTLQECLPSVIPDGWARMCEWGRWLAGAYGLPFEVGFRPPLPSDGYALLHRSSASVVFGGSGHVVKVVRAGARCAAEKAAHAALDVSPTLRLGVKLLSSGMLVGTRPYVNLEYLVLAPRGNHPDVIADDDVIGVLAALDQFHSTGFLHGDCKIGNFVKHKGEWYINDYETAIRAEDAEEVEDMQTATEAYRVNRTSGVFNAIDDRLAVLVSILRRWHRDAFVGKSTREAVESVCRDGGHGASAHLLASLRETWEAFVAEQAS